MKNQSIATPVAIGFTLVLLVSLAGGLIYWLTPNSAQSPRVEMADTKLVAMKQAALAATERGENFLEATGRWNELMAMRPDDRGLVLNQAVTVLLWLKQIEERRSTVVNNDRSTTSRLDRERYDAFKLADKLIVLLSNFPPLQSPTESDLASRQTYLEAALFEARSHEFDGEDAFKLRKLAVDKLLDGLAQDKKASYMLSRLVAWLPTVKQEWPEAKKLAAEVAYQAWKADRQSSFLRIHATSLLLDAQDARCLEPLAAKETTPQELDECRQALEAGEWSRLDNIVRRVDPSVGGAMNAEAAPRELLSMLER